MTKLTDKIGRNEPVRRNGYAAAAVAAAATLLAMLAQANPVTAQAALEAASVAVSQFGVLAFGIEKARSKSYGPRTVGMAMDAEAVIDAARESTENG